MLILYNDNLLIGKKLFISNADPIFVYKKPEENAKSITLPRTSQLILYVIYSVIMPEDLCVC
jgi:hypothetical protein